MSTRKFVEEGQEDVDRARAAMAAFHRALRESQDNRCAVCRSPLGDENHQHMHFDENDENPRLLCPICSATDPVALAEAEEHWREVPAGSDMDLRLDAYVKEIHERDAGESPLIYFCLHDELLLDDAGCGWWAPCPPGAWGKGPNECPDCGGVVSTRALLSLRDSVRSRALGHGVPPSIAMLMEGLAPLGEGEGL